MQLRTLVTMAIVGVAVATLAVVAWVNTPTTLRIAVGPADRDHARLIAAFAQKLQVDHAPIRLKLVRNETLGENARSLDKRQVDLAVVRSDKLPVDGQTLAILHHDPILFLTPQTSRLTRVGQLAGKRLGVVRLTDENRELLALLMAQSHVAISQVKLIEVPPADIDDAFRERRVDALVMMGPLLGSVADMAVHAVAQGSGVPTAIFGVGNAEALSARNRGFDAMEVQRGALVASPPRPVEPVDTLAVTHRLVARSSLDEIVAGTVTRLLFTSRNALAQQIPLANAIEALDPDEAATLGLHPGARAYYAGEQRTFIERYSDWMYMLLALSTVGASGVGMLFSAAARERQIAVARFIEGVQALTPQARLAPDLDTVERLQRDVDALLAEAVARMGRGNMDGAQFTTFTLVCNNVNAALARRERQLLAAGSASAAALAAAPLGTATR